VAAFLALLLVSLPAILFVIGIICWWWNYDRVVGFFFAIAFAPMIWSITLAAMVVVDHFFISG